MQPQCYCTCISGACSVLSWVRIVLSIITRILIFLKTCKTFWKFHYVLHYWTPSGPPSPTTTRIQNLHVVRVGINSGSFLMHSCEKNGLKDTILQKLEKSYTTLSTWQQFCRGAKGGKFIHTAFWKLTELHVNRNNSGLVIFFSHENSLIRILYFIRIRAKNWTFVCMWT